MNYPKRFKSLIALFMVLTILLSSQGMGWGQLNQAFAAEDSNDDQTIVNNDYKTLSLGDTSYITSNLNLPTIGQNGSSISWSSDDAAIDSSGGVTRPLFPELNKQVTLTATISKGEVSLEKNFNVRVIASTDKVSAAYMLHQAQYYYDVYKEKSLASWWDIGAVFGGWGSVNGYNIPDYSGKIKASQPTDYAGFILGMISAGMNPYQTPSGQNLIEELVTTKQGEDGTYSSLSNQQMWAIIALNAANADKIYNGTNPTVPYKKEAAVKKLISMQAASGAFFNDLDTTGMALIAFSGSKEIDGVEAAMTKAINFIHSKQFQTGNFVAGWGNDNSNTDATVISGLVAAGEDITSSKWTVDGKTPIDALSRYQIKNGGFVYQLKQGTVNNLASYQAIIALGDLITGDSVWKRIKLADPKTPEQPEGNGPSLDDLDKYINSASEYFKNSATRVGTDWSAIGLARANQKLPETYVQHLINNVKYSQGNFDLVTDLERTILGLTVAGQDVSDAAGINLLDKLTNHTGMTAQGLNGPIFALIALDSGNYSISADSEWTREKLIQQVLSKQNEDGGFSLSGGSSDPDMTAMVLTALAPYHNNQAVIDASAFDKAITWLSENQQENGGYLSWGVDNSESVAQTIIALTSNHIDPTGADFTKNGVNLLDKLLQFRLPDGTFSHTVELTSNGMATEQALQALDAYKLFKEGNHERLYDFTNPLPGYEAVPSSDVSITIEGPENRIAAGSAKASTPLGALEVFAAANDLDVEKTMSWGVLGLTIQSIQSGYFGTDDNGFWDFAIHRGNKWFTSSNGSMDQLVLSPSDEVIFYYNNWMTMPIDSVTVTPQKGNTLYEDVPFTVLVNKTEMDYSTFGLVPVAAGGVDVSIYSAKGQLIATKKTDSAGKAAFGHLQAGSYTVSVSGYTANSAPTVVHTTKSFEVQSGFTSNELSVPAGDQPRIVVPIDNKDYLIPLTNVNADKEIKIEIPESSQSKIYTNLATGQNLPKIEAVKGNVSIVIPKGAQIVSADSPLIELITTQDTSDSSLSNKIKEVIAAGKTLEGINQAVTFGGGIGRVTFDQFITLTFAGLKGKDAAYIENGVSHAIDIFASDAAGTASGKSEYAFYSGNDLIVKTKHFTDYVVYTLQSNSGSTPGGGTNPQPTKHVTFSVDKLTINKGYVVPVTSLELRDGDTVWSLFKRTLDSQHIAYDYEFYADYNSVYVKSIAGDGEFDHGDGSGWKYNVNGIYPGYGASQYVLKDGDVIQWRYTTNLGLDLEGENLGNGDNGSNPIGNGGEEEGNSGSGTDQTVDLKKLFSDADSISTWALQSITDAIKHGFVQGSGSKFHPKDSVTRAEFAKMLVSVIGLPITTPATGFTDVNAKSWYAPYVNAIATAGYMNGYQQHFYPNESITREEMAVTIVRALGIKNSQSATDIKDLQNASVWAQGDISTVVQSSLMQGANGKFDPHANVTREMAVVVAMRAFNYKQPVAESNK
ncbi:S-layer homology domain-containing protein [Paenibacillus glycanilyticus]|uniref:S-layer homology domain-containing protein n=1 Tax=Paenibacillus glycanilyticus TaxID=126569 RepID=UPI000FDBBAF3|nr:S-layer homology domain-containing protein [Paenibacillus glycanilyticus]